MTIKVRFMGEIRSLAKRREMEIELAEGSRMQDLLVHLGQTLGEAFAKRLFDKDGSLYPHVVLFVNGNELDRAERLQKELVDGEVEVLILPISSGG